MVKKTQKLNTGDMVSNVAVPQTSAIDAGMKTPWRIAIKVLSSGVTMVFDLTDSVTFGRKQGTTEPDIDLTPFKAYELGVSRQHMYLKLRDDHVVIVDNHTVNGTWLNGESLAPDEPYRVRHGDTIKLGALSLQIFFLNNPFDL